MLWILNYWQEAFFLVYSWVEPAFTGFNPVQQAMFSRCPSAGDAPTRAGERRPYFRTLFEADPGAGNWSIWSHRPAKCLVCGSMVLHDGQQHALRGILELRNDHWTALVAASTHRPSHRPLFSIPQGGGPGFRGERGHWRLRDRAHPGRT